MATKHFCDGCDKEVARTDDLKREIVAVIAKDSAMRNTTISSWPPPEPKDGLFEQRQFDLCGECHQRFRATLPPQWERVVPPPAVIAA